MEIVDESEIKTRMDRILMDGIFPVLRDRPATTWKEVAERVSRLLGEKYSASDCNNAASYGRKHKDEYGWLVPPIKRGRPAASDKGRIRVALVEDDGTEAKLTDTEALQIHDGFYSQVRSATTQNQNAAESNVIVAQYEPRRKVRTAMLEHAEDLRYVARKGEQLLRALEEQG